MCNSCGKTKCCCLKVITERGPRGLSGKDGKTGPTGPIGPAGPGVLQFIAVGEILEDTIQTIESAAVTIAGDYIVALEANVEKVLIITPADISFNSYLTKNTVTQNLNANYQHLNRTSGLNCTHTHTAKITLAIGDTVGFQLAMGATAKILNGSIVLSKLP